MKNVRILLPIVTFILVNFFQLVAQSTDWKVMGGLDTVPVYLLYQSDEGSLFGKRQDGMYYSKNGGATWQNIDFYDYIRPEAIIIENNLNDIYLANDRYIYKFDKIALRFVQIIQIDAPILDCKILNSGEIVVATFEQLLKYDANQNKTTLLNWNNSDVKLLSKDNEKIDFAIANKNSENFLLKFSNDMKSITSNRFIPSNIYPQAGSCLLGNRVYISNQYSSNDGISWSTVNGLNVLQYSFLQLGQDNKLYYHNLASIWVSSDLGITFTEIRLPNTISTLNYLKIDPNGNMMIGYTPCGTDYFMYSYNNQTKKWNKIIATNANVEVFYFAAGKDENLVTSNNCGKIYYKENASNPWLYTTSDINPSYITKFKSLENGDIIAASEYSEDMLKSSDKGKTWNIINNDFIPSSNIVVKKNSIYSIDQDQINYTQDGGATWTKVILPASLFISVLETQYDFSDDFTVFYSSFEDGGLHSFNLKNREDKLLIPNVNGSVKTSYDGKILYLITTDFIDVFLSISMDKGNTFSKIKLPFSLNAIYEQFYIDYLGNLYLYGEDKIVMSQDNGVSWQDISPSQFGLNDIYELNVSFDNYVYISTSPKGILKYNKQIQAPNFKFINVNVYSDTNGNCIKDANEPNIPNVKVLLNGNFVQTSDPQGQAKFFTIKDQNIVKTLHNRDLYQSCVDSLVVIIDSTATYQAVDIPLKVLKNCVDIKHTISAPRLRRCFDNYYYGHVYNEGSLVSENTKIKVQLDPYFDYISCTVPVISKSGNELILDLGRLSPGDFKTYQILIKVNCTAPFGSEHCITAISISDGEKCYNNNSDYTECQDNIGSYDPNDKTIFVNGVRDQAYAIPSDKIEYMIRFQNTGTDTAFTVRIEDKFEERFDITSIRPTSASHDYAWKMENGVMVVLFENINLVDSFTNEPLSHGFIKFDIKLNQSTRLGENFSNTAGIFFDFNEPVITNTVTSAVGYPSGTKDNRLAYKIIMKPNPTIGQVSFISEDIKLDGFEATIFNLQGQAVHSTNIPKGQNQIDINALPSGMYFIQLQNAKVKYKTRIVKI